MALHLIGSANQRIDAGLKDSGLAATAAPAKQKVAVPNPTADGQRDQEPNLAGKQHGSGRQRRAHRVEPGP